MTENSITQTTVPTFDLSPLESKIWSCAEPGCGYHIADGPVTDGEVSTDELIRAHLEEHGELTAAVFAPAGYDAPANLDDDPRLWTGESIRPAMPDETPGQVEPDDARPQPQDLNVESERAAYTRGLREIAEWLDDHPEVELPYLGDYAEGSALPALPIFLRPPYKWEPDKADVRTQMATVARAMGRAEKRIKEWVDGSSSFQVWREFGGLVVYAQAGRDEVCERIVVGTEEVTKQVPDPEALAAVPLVEKTETVEKVEWRCGPLLGDATEHPFSAPKVEREIAANAAEVAA
jgi:hypothetical protein